MVELRPLKFHPLEGLIEICVVIASWTLSLPLAPSLLGPISRHVMPLRHLASLGLSVVMAHLSILYIPYCDF